MNERGRGGSDAASHICTQNVLSSKSLDGLLTAAGLRLHCGHGIIKVVPQTYKRSGFGCTEQLIDQTHTGSDGALTTLLQWAQLSSLLQSKMSSSPDIRSG